MADTVTARQEQALVNDSNNIADTMNGSGVQKVAPAAGAKVSVSAPPIAKLAPQTIGTKPTLVEKPPMRFLIMDAPRQSNLAYYIREMKKHNVTHVVRVCDPTYIAGSELANAGITLHEMEFKDGTSPPKELILLWLNLVESTFYGNARSSSPEGPCIAVHCVAGLGRAPQMVAIALIEFAGMDPVEAVSFLRSKRRGAINEKQLLYLSGYKRIKGASADGGCACSIL
jgi:protein tyrosine phosphatase type 4A